MSKKDEKEKVYVDVRDEQLLQDLDVPAMLREHKSYFDKQKDAETEAEKWEKKKKTVSENIEAAIRAVKADGITYTGRSQYKATLVQGQPSEKLNESALFENMMRIGKLNAKTVQEILKASTDPVPAKKSYVLVTVTDTKSAAK